MEGSTGGSGGPFCEDYGVLYAALDPRTGHGFLCRIDHVTYEQKLLWLDIPGSPRIPQETK